MTVALPRVNTAAWPWVGLALAVPASLLCARQAPYLMGVVGFTLFAIPHNMTELTFFFAGRGAVGSTLTRAPRWALAGMAMLMLPAFLYLIPGLLDPSQKMAVFTWHMRAVVAWLACMAAAAPLPVPARVGLAAALALAGFLAWDAPLVTSIVIAHLHHLTALLIAWLILQNRPERRAARPVFLATIAATVAGTVWLLLGPQVLPGPEGPAGAADAISTSIFYPEMSFEMLDRWMAVYSFQLWLHYAVWILLVPALGLIPRPPRLTLGLCVGIAAIASCLFWTWFAQTRTVYLALAGLHAYGEFPLMLFYNRKR